MSSSIQRMLGGAALACSVMSAGALVQAPAGHTEPVTVESPGGGANRPSLATITHAVIRTAPVEEVRVDQDGTR